MHHDNMPSASARSFFVRSLSISLPLNDRSKGMILTRLKYVSSYIFGKQLFKILPDVRKERRTINKDGRKPVYVLPSLEHAKEQFIETNKLYGLVWSDQEELPLRQVS